MVLGCYGDDLLEGEAHRKARNLGPLKKLGGLFLSLLN